MRPKKTTIVVGAGASAEARLPTGAELKKEIAVSLDFGKVRLGRPGQPTTSGDHTLFGALQHEPRTEGCFRAAVKIRNALPQATSIDEYIDAHHGDKEIERCGKLAIVKSILAAEKRSLLYINPGNMFNELNFERVEDTWFNGFWQQLSKKCRANGLKERLSSIVLVIFNYDRCLEHYLYRSIQNYYQLSADAAACLVNSIEIYHPYGTVGSLPWTGGPAPVEFGAEPDSRKLAILAEQIKTFTEGTHPGTSDVEAIRRHVAEADTLIFLGFAYHRQNMELLRDCPKFIKKAGIDCWGTGHGISDVDRALIKHELMGLRREGSINVEIDDLKCRELFEKYSRGLSFV